MARHLHLLYTHGMARFRLKRRAHEGPGDDEAETLRFRRRPADAIGRSTC